MTTALTPGRRSELRAEAHKLRPVVLIGDKGLTDEVIAEIDRSLAAHELIKVRAATDDRAARAAWMEAICARLGAHPVQEIGKVLVVYRANPEPAKPGRPPKAAPREGRGKVAPRRPPAGEAPRTGRKRLWAKAPAEPATATGSGRRRSRTPSPRPESGPRRRRPRTSR